MMFDVINVIAVHINSVIRWKFFSNSFYAILIFFSIWKLKMYRTKVVNDNDCKFKFIIFIELNEYKRFACFIHFSIFVDFIFSSLFAISRLKFAIISKKHFSMFRIAFWKITISCTKYLKTYTKFHELSIRRIRHMNCFFVLLFMNNL